MHHFCSIFFLWYGMKPGHVDQVCQSSGPLQTPAAGRRRFPGPRGSGRRWCSAPLSCVCASQQRKSILPPRCYNLVKLPPGDWSSRLFFCFFASIKLDYGNTYSSLTTNPTWAMQLKSNPSTAFSLQHLWSSALSRYVLGFMNIVGSTNFDAISCTPSCNWTTIPGVTPPYASPSSTRRGRFFSTIKRTVRRLWATTCTARRFKTPYVPAPG